MSLINDMLQDLDRRGRAHPEEAGASPQELLADTGFSRSSRVWWPGIVISALVVAVLVATLVWLYGAPESGSQTPVLEPERDLGFEPPEVQREAALHEIHPGAPLQTGVVDETPDIRLEPQHLAQALLPRPESAEADSAENGVLAERRSQRTLEEWLARAREALERDRLTRPSDDNAHDYYQQVLALDPEQPEALAGLAAISRRYRELVERSLDEGNLDTARTYIRRARSIRSGDTPELQASAERLAGLEQAREPSPEARPAADSDSHLDVRPDLTSRDRRRAEVARQLWERGDRMGARAELERTLADFEAFEVPAVESTILLVELYLEAEDIRSAQTLLAEADYVPSVERVRLEAQLLLHRGEVEAAVTALESELDAAEEHELYRALLARLYFAEERHDEAVASYQSLLRDFGSDPAYWLGLGLAEDARDAPEAALQAFRRALDRGQYAPGSAIRRFLERRIDALARELNAQDN